MAAAQNTVSLSAITASALPADWLEPMQRPASMAAAQNTVSLSAITASATTAIQPTSVRPSARLWPMRSSR